MSKDRFVLYNLQKCSNNISQKDCKFNQNENIYSINCT